MAIYSYSQKIIPGPMGTTYDFQPGNTSYIRLGELDNKFYLHIDDDSEILPQWPEINFQEDVLPEEILNNLKQEKIAQINLIADKFDSVLKNESMVITSSLGYRLNADIRAQINLLSIFVAGEETAEIATVDQEVKTITLEQAKTISKEITENGKFLYTQKWTKFQQIAEATTYDELAAVSLDFVMKDFTA